MVLLKGCLLLQRRLVLESALKHFEHILSVQQRRAGFGLDCMGGVFRWRFEIVLVFMKRRDDTQWSETNVPRSQTARTLRAFYLVDPSEPFPLVNAIPRLWRSRDPGIVDRSLVATREVGFLASSGISQSPRLTAGMNKMTFHTRQCTGQVRGSLCKAIFVKISGRERTADRMAMACMSTAIDLDLQLLHTLFGLPCTIPRGRKWQGYEEPPALFCFR